MLQAHTSHEVPFKTIRTYTDDYAVKWCHLKGSDKPCFSIAMLNELLTMQEQLKHTNNKILAITGEHPDVFSYGGDLEYFASCVESGNKHLLYEYAHTCIKVLCQNSSGYDNSIHTIALVTGAALGGGFEAALSCHFIIAEKRAVFGFPEPMFNLFPGMGAHVFLSNKVGAAIANRIIQSGKRYSADELYNLGIIDLVVENGTGVSSVHKFSESLNKKVTMHKALDEVRTLISPVDASLMTKIVNIWVDSAMKVSNKELRIMKRIARNQQQIG